MANYLSKVKLGNTTYSLKDEEVRAAVAVLQAAAASSLVFKGVVSSATDITSLTDYKIGHTYKASANFELLGLGKVESGDMIICIANYADEYKAANWTIVQNNIDVMTGSTESSAGVKGLVPVPAIGDQNNFLRGDGTWQSCAISWGSFTDLVIAATPFEWGDENAEGDNIWWSGLKRWIYTATHEQRLACEGKTKKMVLSIPTLGANAVTMLCIGADQDGDKTLTFQTKGCLPNTTQFDDNSSEWASNSTARTLCQNFYNYCAAKDSIKIVSKGTCFSANNNRNASVDYNDETVFLLSERELGGDKYSPISTANSTTTNAECTYGYNEPYHYYTDNNKRKKHLMDANGNMTSNEAWYWGRSRHYSTDSISNVCYVRGSGELYQNPFTYKSQLAPAFVIG